jgi:hypothetical protein
VVDSPFCFETWRGVRVGSHRCPILRPGTFGIAFLDVLRTGAMGGPFPASLLKLLVARGENLRLATAKFVERGDVAQGTVQADFVVPLDVIRNQTPGVFQRQRRARPDAIAPARALTSRQSVLLVCLS